MSTVRGRCWPTTNQTCGHSSSVWGLEFRLPGAALYSRSRGHKQSVPTIRYAVDWLPPKGSDEQTTSMMRRPEDQSRDYVHDDLVRPLPRSAVERCDRRRRTWLTRRTVSSKVNRTGSDRRHSPSLGSPRHSGAGDHRCRTRPASSKVRSDQAAPHRSR